MRRAILISILIAGLVWGQVIPDVDNRVAAEVRVTEVFQSGNQLRVTVQNISGRVIRGLSFVLGKHRVNPDWSRMAGGGLGPNATASIVISMAGLPAGGTRHHAAAPGVLEVSGAVFGDGGRGAAVEGPKSIARPATQAVKPAEVTVESGAQVPTAPVPARPVVAPVRESKRVASPAGPTAVAASVPAAGLPPVAAVRAVKPAEVTVQSGAQVPMAPAPARPVVVPVQEPRRVSSPAEPTAAAASVPAAGLPPVAAVQAVKPAEVTVQSGARVPMAPAPARPVVAPVEEPKRVASPAEPPAVAASVPAAALPPVATVQAVKPAEVTVQSGAPVPTPTVPARPVVAQAINPAEVPPTPPAAAAASPTKEAQATGTREQGSRAEIAKLIALVEIYEPELADPFPRQALNEMVAAVVKEQNEVRARADVTEFNHGERSALQSFAYGIELIKDRRDIDDDAVREQVARFLRNQRQALGRH